LYAAIRAFSACSSCFPCIFSAICAAFESATSSESLAPAAILARASATSSARISSSCRSIASRSCKGEGEG
jgi:hypothetical protein